MPFPSLCVQYVARYLPRMNSFKRSTEVIVGRLCHHLKPPKTDPKKSNSLQFIVKTT